MENQKKCKYLFTFSMFLSSCTFTNKQVKIDACSRINTQIIESQHALRSYNVQQNTCTVVNTEHYKIYSISPIVPNEALEKNIEGIVRIQFSVTLTKTLLIQELSVRQLQVFLMLLQLRQLNYGVFKQFQNGQNQRKLKLYKKSGSKIIDHIFLSLIPV